MPIFQYVVKDPSARKMTGRITAESESEVVAELRKRNVTIISIVPLRGAARRSVRLVRKKVRQEDLVVFARQLATMVEAGIPILHALDALREQVTHPYFQEILQTVRDDIQSGSSLSAAFSKHPAVFDPLFVNMVKVGETGGVLSTLLDRIAGYMEKTLRLKRKVKSALIYPAVVICMAIGITTLLLVKVVPTFAKIYESFDAELPLLTQVLISFSNLLKEWILVVIAVLVVLGFLLSRWYRTDRGRMIIDRTVLNIPIFGPLIRKVVIGRFSRTLGTLIQAGVPILESLDIVGRTSGNRVVEQVIDGVKTNVREGESISTPLIKSGIFPPMVTRMILIGERSGQLEKMLNKIAEFYDDQVDTAVAALTSIIEPLIIGFLGVVVGFIVVALFLPIITLTQIIQG